MYKSLHSVKDSIFLNISLFCLFRWKIRIMKKLVLPISMLLFFWVSLEAQTRRMDNVVAAKTYTSENQNETVQPLIMEARRQFRVADFEGVLMTLDNAIAQEPNSAEALAERARFKKIIGMDTEAQIDLRKANQINPYAANIYGYYGNLGLLEVLSVKPEASVYKLTDFQKLNYYYRSLDQEMLVSKGEEEEIGNIEDVLMAIENDELSIAINWIDSFFLKNSNSATAYDLKGLVLRKKGNYSEAKAAFARAVELDPLFAIGWYNLGQVERNLGNYKSAEKYLNKAIGLEENLTKAYFERALLMKQLGKKEAALKDYDMILKLEGKNYMEALVNRGLTKKMMGDFNGAMSDLNKAIEELPRQPELRKNRGNIHLLLGMPRKAVDDYTKAIQFNSNYAEAYYNRAIAFFILYDKVSACADLEKSIDLGYPPADQLKKYFCTW